MWRINLSLLIIIVVHNVCAMEMENSSAQKFSCKDMLHELKNTVSKKRRFDDAMIGLALSLDG